MHKKRIFFLTTDDNTPSGGRLFIYHLVDILVKNGFDAYALHQKRNFRYTWFKNTTPVCYTYQIKKQRVRSNKLKHWARFFSGIIKDYLTAPREPTQRVMIDVEDLLVLPATRTLFCYDVLPGVPKISLSQGPFLLFQGSRIMDPDLTIFHTDIKARIAMSKLNYDMHNLVFPKGTVWEVPIFIDADLYGYSEVKKQQIAYMPRRLHDDSNSLINLLKLRGNLADYSFLPIDGLSPEEVASALKESLIFLSFSHREGFGLPPAEAMTCGCIVIGYSGNGGDEFFNKDLCFKIPDGDLISYVDTVEKVANEYLNNPEPLDRMRKQASEYILDQYTKAHTESGLLRVMNEII